MFLLRYFRLKIGWWKIKYVYIIEMFWNCHKPKHIRASCYYKHLSCVYSRIGMTQILNSMAETRLEMKFKNIERAHTIYFACGQCSHTHTYTEAVRITFGNTKLCWYYRIVFLYAQCTYTFGCVRKMVIHPHMSLFKKKIFLHFYTASQYKQLCQKNNVRIKNNKIYEFILSNTNTLTTNLPTTLNVRY